MFGPHWDDNPHGRQNTMGGLMFNGDIDRYYDDKAKLGIIPRSIEQVFASLEVMTRDQPEREFTVYCSFLQIYNEKLFDLLQDRRSDRPLVIREDKYAGIFVEG